MIVEVAAEAITGKPFNANAVNKTRGAIYFLFIIFLHYSVGDADVLPNVPIPAGLTAATLT